MQPMAQADELAMVRSRIAQLKLRERELREALVAADGEARLGRWTRAEVVERRLRVFDHRRLPAALRDEPLFWRDRILRDVTCEMRDDALGLWPGTRAIPAMGAADAALIGHALRM